MIAHDSRPQAMAHYLLQQKLYAIDTVGYRTSDFCYHWTGEMRDLLIGQAMRYNFSSAAGILQYPLLPLKNVPANGLGIGLTPLVPLATLGEQLNINLLVKCEHHNPSGSFKDRETLIAHLGSVERDYRTTIGFSSGNACCSAAHVASRSGRRFIAIVSGDIYREKLTYMTDRGIDVITIGGQSCYFEKAYQVFLRAKRHIEFELNGIDDWSVNNPYRVEGDKSIALEIIHQVGQQMHGTFQVPDFVVLPTANGSCLSGVWKGFKELFNLGLISKMPKMVSIGIENASPIFKLRQHNVLTENTKCDLRFLDDENSSIGSTLIAEESFDLFNGHHAIKESNGFAYEGNARDIRHEYRQLFALEMETLLAHDLMPEPCSVLSLTAVRKMKSDRLLMPGDSVVVVFTGHARKSIRLLEEFSNHVPQYNYWLYNQKIREVRDESCSAEKGEVLSASEHPGDLEKLLLSLL